MNCSSSQLDPYTPPNEHQIFYPSYKPSQQIKPSMDLNVFLVYHGFLTNLASGVLNFIFIILFMII